MKNLRSLSAKIINEVTDGKSLSDAMNVSFKDPRDKAFVQAVCYGVCRFYTRLDEMLSLLLKKPLKGKESVIHALLLVGLFQLWAMRIPAYAAVTETVNATEELKKSWAKGLVNAVLRNYTRQQETIENKMEEFRLSDKVEEQVAYYAHPIWWINKIKEAWPREWQTILNANNEHPPLALRVNQQRISREEYQKKLQLAHLPSHIISETKSGIIVDTPISVEELPGFSEGEVSVQDGAAQLAAELLNLKPKQHVLDACAAPGGKLTHILEIERDSTVVAIEKDLIRFAYIKENLKRLNKEAQCILGDAARVETWWDKKLFDRILLDAPCSASGVLRRHPDIKLLRQSEDIQNFAQKQYHLLSKLWPLLTSGGLFLYVTCSIFPEENVNVMSEFLSSHQDAKEEKIEAHWGYTLTIGRQILPGMHKMDGFYFALMRKV